MAKISGNLRDEENFGGFESDPNDDTFLLDKEMEYPGELPDFGKTPVLPEVKPEEQLEVNYQGITKAPMISMDDQPGAESVWDMFDQPEASTGAEDATPVPAITKDELDEGTIPRESESFDIEQEIIPPLEQEEFSEDEGMSTGKFETDTEEQLQSERISLEPDEELPPPVQEETVPEEAIMFDSPEQPEDEQFASEREVPEMEAVNPDEKFEFALKELDEPSEETMNQSIENIEQYEDLQLDDDFKNQILNDLEKSRTKKRKDEQEDVIVKKVSLSDEAPVLETIAFDEFKGTHPSKFGIEGEEEENENTEESDDKKGGIFPWLYLGYAAIALLILAGLSFGGYYLATQTDIFTASAEKAEPAKPPKGITKKKVIAKPIVKAIAKPKIDTIKAVVKAETPKDTVKKVVAAAEYKPTKPRWETTDIHEKKPKLNPAKVEYPYKKVITKIDRVEKAIKTANVLPKEQIYTVELYSTPSEEDANMWAAKLKSRNVDIKIIKHKLRDKTFYKIRYGKFSSREEAKTEAVKLGYPQTWVDRVK